MAIGGLQIFVLKKTGGREHDIGKVRRVGEKLFMYDGEQVRPHQAADYDIVVRATGCWIGVVNKERLYRRIIGVIELLAQLGHVQSPRRPAKRFLHEIRSLQ